MRTLSTAVLLWVAGAMPLAFAEIVTRTGSAHGVITAVEVDAATATDVRHWPEGADPRGEHRPFTFDGAWSFTWDPASVGQVTFTGTFHFGDHFTVSDAGSLGGISKQIFHDFAHHVAGTGGWNATTRTLTFSRQPGERDAGGASTVTQARPPDCEKVKGLMAGRACSAFQETSPELEGLDLLLTFDEGLDSFSGTAVMVQYGGSGMTSSRTDMTTTIEGRLE